MKYIKHINEYFANISEGFNYNKAVDANLYDVGVYILSGSGENPDEMDEKDVEKAAVEAIKKTKPVPLTGIVKKDLPALLSYIGPAFKKCGVELDVDNAVIESPNFANEIMIPVAGTDYCLLTMLDYSELAYNGSQFTIGATFYSDEEGTLDDGQIDDLSNQGEVVRACAEFNKYLKNTQK